MNDKYQKIAVPHKKGTIRVIHPFLSEKDYYRSAKKISSMGLQRPNASELSSVLRYGYTWDHLIVNDIKEIMEEGVGYQGCNGFDAFTGVFFVPDGVLFQDNPGFSKKAEEDDVFISDYLMAEPNDLMSRLGSRQEDGVTYGENTLRFTPYGFKTGVMTAKELAKNNFIIGLMSGREGAEDIGYVASKFPRNPELYVYSFETTKKPIIKHIVRMYCEYPDSQKKLVIDGIDYGEGLCSSFGILRD